MNLTTFKKITPGVGASLSIALLAQFLEALMPIHLIGASVIALFIGIVINSVCNVSPLKDGIKFTSKKILKFAIVLLGMSLSIQTILEVGAMSLTVMIFTLLTCFGGGYFIGKGLGLDWKLSNLISAGTGICGGSAIAAIAPVIEAEDTDIAYAMSATFLFDMFMIVAFPFMGHALGLSDIAYGLWTGTAVNDTSSVVAAAYAYSEEAGEFATMVKLTRTLSIIPTVLAFSYINLRVKQKEQATFSGAVDHLKETAVPYEVSQLDQINLDDKKAKQKVDIKSLFPWFIVGFVGLSVVNSFGFIPVEVSSAAKSLSKFLMVAALAAIGLNTSYKDMKKSGIAPMLHGFIISILVVIVAISVEWSMGLV